MNRRAFFVSFLGVVSVARVLENLFGRRQGPVPASIDRPHTLCGVPIHRSGCQACLRYAAMLVDGM